MPALRRNDRSTRPVEPATVGAMESGGSLAPAHPTELPIKVGGGPMRARRIVESFIAPRLVLDL
jgi:hypothetical protein